MMARFEIDFLMDYGDSSLLDELRRIAVMLPKGKPLTKSAFKQHQPKVAESTVCRRFGGWREALERAGLGHLYSGHPVTQKMRAQPARKFSKADLIAELRRVHALIGKGWLTSADFNTRSITSEDAIRGRFGNFRKGLEAAGIPYHPNKTRQSTDQQCFENLAEVWTHFGRAPAYREMFKPPSEIQGKTYIERWGTWRRTLKAFVDWTNTDYQPRQERKAETKATVAYDKPTEVRRDEADCREVRPGLRFKVFMRDRFRCVYCGRSPATHNIVLHADHKEPVAKGGKTTLDDLCTSCRDCNLAKGSTVITGLVAQ
jgi:hypothetical protein